MTGSRSSNPQQPESRHPLLATAIGFGVVLLLAMLYTVFGPSAIGFGAIVLVIAFAVVVRRYRFSLRALLLVVIVLNVWLGLKVDRDVRMNRAVSSIKSNGGNLKVRDRRPNFPWGFWKYRYRLDFFGLDKALSEQAFAPLEVLAPSSLQWLDLSNTGATDESLRFIKGLTRLEYLSLANETYYSGQTILDRPQNTITDAGLARLVQLTELKGIDLSGTDITDDGLKLLSAMPNLKWIYLNGTRVKGPGIAHLSKHKHLGILELNGCAISPVGYQELVNLSNLTSLGLRSSGATDADLKLLTQLTRLGILRLARTNVSDEAVSQFVLAHPECKVER